MEFKKLTEIKDWQIKLQKGGIITMKEDCNCCHDILPSIDGLYAKQLLNVKDVKDIFKA